MKATPIIAAALIFAAPAAAATAGWHIVKSGSATGQFAVKAVSASVNHPAGLAVRLVGQVQSGSGVVSCSRNYGIASWSRSYSHAGTFTLPMTRGADSCDVIASVGGAGRVTVQILRR